MYELIKSAISAGGYRLTEMQHKIKKFFLLEDLTEREMEELLQLAAAGVSAAAERPGTLELINTLDGKISALEARVKALEGGTAPEAPEYPDWKPWDGISTDYQPGAIVLHNGQLWKSVFHGQNVWEPGTTAEGSLWMLYTPHTEDAG